MMKALSIQQPWAWLIVHGYKDIENREWRSAPSYRGKLMIHASKKFDYSALQWVKDRFPHIAFPGKFEDLMADSWKHYNLGAFIGICRLNDVVEMDRSPWFFGPLGFKLRMPKPIKPIPFKGKLGLFDVPEYVIDKIQY